MRSLGEGGIASQKKIGTLSEEKDIHKKTQFYRSKKRSNDLHNQQKNYKKSDLVFILQYYCAVRMMYFVYFRFILLLDVSISFGYLLSPNLCVYFTVLKARFQRVFKNPIKHFNCKRLWRFMDLESVRTLWKLVQALCWDSFYHNVENYQYTSRLR